ncbi:protein of unknown function [Candidatus Filomicrobium marinum]|uniref:Uncharacterized protein n=1 Tax=Candidatus Filomicrobium marinum TaxID=1608628 RepID=A0A0D6JLL0_9HYPH|nr:protein of unknown function [Candidatus Filomicrobium marinum]CPR22530.1 protein of unknown function [Candidatus Filomicrobium marinum]
MRSAIRGWTVLSRHSSIRSTARDGSRFLLPSAQYLNVTATPAASTVILHLMLRHSMQAARDLRRRSMVCSRICRTIQMSGTSYLSRFTATSRFSRSTATDASSFLRGLGRTRASRATSPLSVLARSFKCGNRANSKSGAIAPAQKLEKLASYSGASQGQTTAGTREHGNDAATRVGPAGKGRSKSGSAHSRASLGSPRGSSA